MKKSFVEREFAYEWRQEAVIIDSLEAVKDWSKDTRNYTIVDSIYDTPDNTLSKESTGVRIRSKNSHTVVTAKKFLRRGPNGEGIFEEKTQNLGNSEHPLELAAKPLDIDLPDISLIRQLSFHNARIEVNFRYGDKLVRVINEDITYSDEKGTFREPLLEVEFENVADELIKSVRHELETKFQLKMIHEGKTDRALRFLANNTTSYIQNVRDIDPVVMQAHGGKGNISMRFFHTVFSRFETQDQPKSIDYKRSNWEFFAHAILPVGSEVKEHLHDRTDEFYFILKGSATFTVDGVSSVIQQGDCILTRKGSRHSLTNVTEDLEFIATEIL